MSFLHRALVRRRVASPLRCFATSEEGNDIKLSRSPCGLWATLTMARPQSHNALSVGMIDGFYGHLEALAAVEHEMPRAVFLRAEGKTFCAGGDLKAMRASGTKCRAENVSEAMHLSGVFAALRNFPRPVVALVDGPCFGGGVGIISACDMAFATPKSLFALSEVTLGVIPATISPFVIDRMGPSAASRYFLTAERFDAAEAHRVGLLHGVVEEEGLEEGRGGLDKLEASLRTSFSRCSPQALAASKRLIADVAHRPPNSAALQVATADYLADVRQSADGQEGMLAFIEKRKPNWNPSD